MVAHTARKQINSQSPVPNRTRMSFRDIDIDALEGNYMTAVELQPDLPPLSSQEVVQVAHQAKQALLSGHLLPALQLVLENPPYTSEVEAKDSYANIVFDVLVAIRNNSLPSDLANKFVKQLSEEQQDTLVKYLYKNMALPTGAKQGAILLTWFEKTIEVTGVGSIVRFMSDRRTV